MVENADDILEEFEFTERLPRNSNLFTGIPEKLPEMGESERKVYEIIGNYPIHVDKIVRAGGMDAGEVLSVLMQMELKGIVKQLPGKMFVR